jgi:hypothetical protein
LTRSWALPTLESNTVKLEAAIPIADWVRAIRRNHAAEHATIAVLSRRYDRFGQLGGRAVLNGFYVYGPATTEDVESAAKEAIQRLRGGEETLAVSPFCGTNFLVAGAVTTVAATLTLGTRDRLQRLPQAVSMAVLALIWSFRLGGEIQKRWTTLPRVGGLALDRVEQRRGGQHAVHRVYTRGVADGAS